ncbi:hypothetical protein RB195_020096 [Necator americanus]|uniref:Uncharacterized protein n=1 Tax=Necator americanus TaxID=51031 RepID=A0ABR1CJ53_NECAM
MARARLWKRGDGGGGGGGGSSGGGGDVYDSPLTDDPMRSATVEVPGTTNEAAAGAAATTTTAAAMAASGRATFLRRTSRVTRRTEHPASPASHTAPLVHLRRCGLREPESADLVHGNIRTPQITEDVLETYLLSTQTLTDPGLLVIPTKPLHI